MKYLVEVVFFITTFCLTCCSFIKMNADMIYEYPAEYSEEVIIPEVQNCTKMDFHCETCRDLVMCIETDYGFTKQYIQCPNDQTCLRGKCSSERNPLCDGTRNVQFHCHVPGVFPDPFDCKKYHFCAPKHNKVFNESADLKHYEHTCQNEGQTEYSYDPQTFSCKNPIYNGCTDWPIPLCQFEGHSEALKNNLNIFFVCEKIYGHLYPHLYACPHGQQYDALTTQCGNFNTPHPQW